MSASRTACLSLVLFFVASGFQVVFKLGPCLPAYSTGQIPAPEACDANCFPTTTCGAACLPFVWYSGGCQEVESIACYEFSTLKPTSICRGCRCDESETWRCVWDGQSLIRREYIVVQDCYQ